MSTISSVHVYPPTCMNRIYEEKVYFVVASVLMFSVDRCDTFCTIYREANKSA